MLPVDLESLAFIDMTGNITTDSRYLTWSLLDGGKVANADGTTFLFWQVYMAAYVWMNRVRANNVNAVDIVAFRSNMVNRRSTEDIRHL